MLLNSSVKGKLLQYPAIIGRDIGMEGSANFAGGDIVTGSATVIKAMGAGRVAAIAINEYLGDL